MVKYDYGNPFNSKIPSPKIREVAFIKGQFCLKNDTYHYNAPVNTPLHYNADDCEVIGNIFENPDLLNK